MIGWTVPTRVSSQMISPTRITAAPEPSPQSIPVEGLPVFLDPGIFIAVVCSPAAGSTPNSLKKSSCSAELITSVGRASCTGETVVFWPLFSFFIATPFAAATRWSRNSSAVWKRSSRSLAKAFRTTWSNSAEISGL